MIVASLTCGSWDKGAVEETAPRHLMGITEDASKAPEQTNRRSQLRNKMRMGK